MVTTEARRTTPTAAGHQIGGWGLGRHTETFRGTHNGEFMGISPTGNRVALDAIDILRVTDGQLTEHWTVPDMFGFMQHLGALPSSPR